MPSTVLSAATLGIDAYPVHVEIEVDTDRTLPTFTVRESKEHVLAAIKNTGYQLATPPRHRQSRTGGSS